MLRLLRRYMPWAIGAWLLITATIAGTLTWRDAHPRAADTEAARHEGTGTIRSFGPDRSYVNIAHDAIPGFMDAMTMAFEFQGEAQSSGLEVSDRIEFTFTADRQGRLVIASISKRR
ncbi:MAG TPA: copper-binding protein [Polyangiaceae bacterium]|nr:copper-binding protein [Polyangiaceae bacterium]